MNCSYPPHFTMESRIAELYAENERLLAYRDKTEVALRKLAELLSSRTSLGHSRTASVKRIKGFGLWREPGATVSS